MCWLVGRARNARSTPLSPVTPAVQAKGSQSLSPYARLVSVGTSMKHASIIKSQPIMRMS